MEFLGECGVTAPNIIRRVNKFRNTVEHDYYLPCEDEVQEYLDIVDLYLLATHQIAINFPDRPSAELMSDDEEYDESMGYPNELEIYFPEGKGELKIIGDNQIIVELGIKHPEYFKWIYALVKQSIS